MAGRCPGAQDSSGGARLPKKFREMDPHKAYVVSPPPLPDSPTQASRPPREFQSARGNIMVCCKTIPGAETAEKKERLLARIDAMLVTWEQSGKETMAELQDVEQRLSQQGALVLWCFVLHSHRLFLAPQLVVISIERYEIICV